MKFDDFGDFSSFNNPNDQKGLITFYQEQWNQVNKKDTYQQDKNIQTGQSRVKNIVKPKHTPLKELINIDTKSHKSIVCMKKSQSFTNTQLKEITKNVKPFNFIPRKSTIHSESLNSVQKLKENKIISIQKTLLEKHLPKIKQVKTFQSLHIQKFPFQHKSTDQNDPSRLSNEMLNLRIRKGSSFKGFHKQNFSTSTVGLSKDILLECHKKVNRSFDQLQANKSSFGSYFLNKQKKVSNYQFPVDNSDCCFLRKINDKKIDQYEDSLNQFCKKLPNQRKQRNTESSFTILKQLNS